MTVFQVKFRTFDEARDRAPANGGYAYRANAAAHRDELFDRWPAVSHCWIERDGKLVGPILVREPA
jgi:hypothetical protein